LSVNIFNIAVKYDLPIKQYFLQGFLASLTCIFETLAILIGMSVAVAVCMVLPPLAAFGSIGVIMIPWAWFSIASITRFENLFYKGQNNGEA
jgi:uncharacterized membrane protein YesL